jgi:hypothetical protein
LQDKFDPHKGMIAKWSKLLASGEVAYIFNLNPKRDIFMQNKLEGEHWLPSSSYHLVRTNQERSFLSTTFVNSDRDGHELQMRVDFSLTSEKVYHLIMLYAPYWIINQTEYVIELLQHRTKVMPVAGQKYGFLEQSANPRVLMFDYKEVVKGFWDNDDAMSLSLVVKARIGEGKPRVDPKDPLQSPPFSVDDIQPSQDIQVENRSQKFNLGVSVEIHPGKFYRTHLVKITTRFVCVNSTNLPILVRQHGDEQEGQLVTSSGRLNFYWTHKSSNPLLCIRFESYSWSTPFDINFIGEVPLILHHDSQQHMKYVTVRIHPSDGVVYVIINSTEHPPFFLWNQYERNITVHQKGKVSEKMIVPPGESVPFVWGDIHMSHELDVSLGDEHTASLNIDVISRIHQIEFPNHPTMWVTIIASGTTKNVYFKNSKDDTIERLFPKQTGKTMKELVIQPKINFQFLVDLKGIGISLIDDQPKELMYFRAENIRMECQLCEGERPTDRYQSVYFQVGKIVVNNQAFGAKFPVVFSNRFQYEEKKNEFMLRNPFLAVQFVRMRDTTFDYVPSLIVTIQEADLQLDIGFVVDIYTFFKSIRDKVLHKSIATDSQVTRDDLLQPRYGQGQDFGEIRKVYFELMLLYPIHINLVLHLTPELSSNENISNAVRENTMMVILENLGTSIVTPETMISLQGVQLQYAFMNRAAFFDNIKLHYTRNVVEILHKMLGHVIDKIIGSPIGLFKNYAGGVDGEMIWSSAVIDSNDAPEQRQDQVLIKSKRTLPLMTYRLREGQKKREDKRQSRLTRVFKSDGVLRPYDVEQAFGQHILYTVNDGAFFKLKDFYRMQIQFATQLVILTEDHILVVKKTPLSAQFELEWQNHLGHFNKVELVKKKQTAGLGIVLHMTKEAHRMLEAQQGGWFGKSIEPKRELESSDKEAVEALYQQLKTLIDSWNERKHLSLKVQ